jgi:hypothetical protein
VGAYNVVVAARENPCLRCGCTRTRVQFTFADTWQYEYQVGDRLAWGGNDKGQRGLREIRLHGYPEDCPDCGLEAGGDFIILIQDDAITEVRLVAGKELEELLAIEREQDW